MAFTQSCFIRKNTPELRKKLEELGYDYYTPNGIKSDNIVASFGFIFDICSIDTIKLAFNNCIDCGDNEELFLALAALRYDTDINQIYLWNERHLVKCIRDYSCTLNIEATPYYMCQLIDNSDIKFEIPCKELRKATVEEIIEHFK